MTRAALNSESMKFTCHAWDNGVLADFWVRRTPCRYYLVFVGYTEYHVHVEYWKRDRKLPYGGKWVTLCLAVYLED